MFKKIGISLAALGAASIGVYLGFIRPWQLHWGATDEEVARIMVGDEVVKHPTFNATRTVTIKARPEEIMMDMKRRAEYASRVTSELIEATGSSPTI